ncbi:DapH/DapD/GlmU-related protein [Roseovarius aquimarinus]|uniref:DapH/DapD/GlmU-related protein n=1 Tax=Roseovarius aquimarinus TaxID=1229156 RepID=A0ABW7I5R5_9RHOB
MLGDDPLIGADCRITASTLGRFVEIGDGVVMDHSEMGDYSYCMRLCDIANARIGKFANIASMARIGATDHPLDRASLHHFMYRAASYWPDAEDEAAFFERRRARRVTIGHDTWIGHGALIRPEVTIGTGAVVGAGSVVTRDVAPYSIVAGNPARAIRDRQPPEIAERLIALGWWDWSHDALRLALEDFRQMPVAAFLKKYE